MAKSKKTVRKKQPKKIGIPITKAVLKSGLRLKIDFTAKRSRLGLVTLSGWT